MFDSLSQRLGQTLRRLRGTGRLTERNVQEALREVRMALLEADVALPVVRGFVERGSDSCGWPGCHKESHTGPGSHSHCSR